MSRDILYVDDERDNLIVFEASFEKIFNVRTASSGAQALEILNQHSFPVVIADQRMPQMTGSELFEIMRRKYPHTKRVMLTGYADSKAMLDAINQGQVYYFLKKPWERHVVLSVLVHAVESYDLAIANMALTERLVQSDRCATLGRSAARIAHEMGNQLCMLPLLELIEEQYAEHKELVRTAAVARKTYERLVELVAEVKSFVRFENEDLALMPLSLAELVHELVEFLRYDNTLARAPVAVKVLAEPQVMANRIKLQQVLLNLLKNAAHAVREKTDGRITIVLDHVEPWAVLRVEDNGCGMAADVAARIWEPFFTTKGDEGTGLGLDIVKGIVEAHRGRIECTSAPGAGAVFSIQLPAATANPGASHDCLVVHAPGLAPAEPLVEHA